MAIAPPPTGSRLEELGDALVVRFRPRRSWAELAFLICWLALWTFGGIAAFYGSRTEDVGVKAFVALWLCGWAYGVYATVREIAWQLIGREFLIVTPQQLELRKETGRFVQTKTLDAGLVQAVEAQRTPHGEDERPRQDFSLALTYGEETIQVGEGMGEREAQYIAASVLSRIRPRSWWGDEQDDSGPRAMAQGLPLPKEPRRRIPAFVAITAGFFVGVFALLLATHDRTSKTSPARPVQDEFAAEDVRVCRSVHGTHTIEGDGLRDAEVLAESNLDALDVHGPSAPDFAPVRRTYVALPLFGYLDATTRRRASRFWSDVRTYESAEDRKLISGASRARTTFWECRSRQGADIN
jgi:hypothetical protein